MHMLYLYDEADSLPDSAYSTAEQLLPGERRERVQSYRSMADRKRSALAYLLLRYGLRVEYGLGDVPPFSFGSNGKPFLSGRGMPCFSLSHSGRYAGCALANYEVGLDIQEVTDIKPRTMRRMCTREEKKRIKEARDFCALWTRKESVAKLTGEGMVVGALGRDILVRNPEAVVRTLALGAGSHFLSVSRWRAQPGDEPDTEAVYPSLEELLAR